MTDPEKNWLKGFGTGAASVLLITAFATVGCTKPVEPVALKVEAAYDLAALNVYDCGQLVFVAFIKSNGGAEGIRIASPVILDDTKLRLATVPYAAVHYFSNDRPCGFALQEKDAL